MADQESALREAARKGDHATVKKLLANGAAQKPDDVSLYIVCLRLNYIYCLTYFSLF